MLSSKINVKFAIFTMLTSFKKLIKWSLELKIWYFESIFDQKCALPQNDIPEGRGFGLGAGPIQCSQSLALQ